MTNELTGILKKWILLLQPYCLGFNQGQAIAMIIKNVRTNEKNKYFHAESEMKMLPIGDFVNGVLISFKLLTVSL